MRGRVIKAARGEEGMALPLVLILLAVGGLTLAPYLSYISTGLNAGRVVEKNVNGFYAADAGVEHALWKLKNDPPASYPYSYELTDLNGMSVAVLVEELTAIYGVVLGSPGAHSDYMTVDGDMVYDTGLGAYVYTVTVSNKSTSTIHVDEILVKPPEGFAYVPGSTSGHFSDDDPGVRGEASTGITLLWDFQTPRPSIRGAPSPDHPTVAAHTFWLSGPAGYSGGSGNVWVVATREDIGSVGQACAFKITASARRGGATVATIRAGALKDSGTETVLVSFWEVNPR